MKSFISIVIIGLLTVTSFAADVIVDLTGHKNAAALITMEKTDNLIVQLDENPTTGYSWTVPQAKITDLVPMFSLKNAQFARAGDSELQGTAGVKSLTFGSNYVATGHLIIAHAKIWELEQVTNPVGHVDLDKAHLMGFDVTLLTLNVKSTAVATE